jgi:hypothetical protein
MQDNFDKSLRNALQNYEVPYNPADWSAMEQQLNVLEAAKKEQKNYKFAYWLAASVLLNVGLGTYLWWDSQYAPQENALASNNSSFVTTQVEKATIPLNHLPQKTDSPPTFYANQVTENKSATNKIGEISANRSSGSVSKNRSLQKKHFSAISKSSKNNSANDNNSTFLAQHNSVKELAANPFMADTVAALQRESNISLNKQNTATYLALSDDFIQPITDTLAIAQLLEQQPDSIIIAKSAKKNKSGWWKMSIYFGPEHNWTADKARGNGYAAGAIGWLKVSEKLQVGAGISLARRSYTDNINSIVTQEMEVGTSTMTHFKMDGHSIELPVLLAYRLNNNAEHPFQLKAGIIGGSQLQNRCSYGYASVENVMVYKYNAEYGGAITVENTKEVRRQIHRQDNNYSAGKPYAATYVGISKEWSVSNNFSCGIEPFMQIVMNNQSDVMERIPNATGLRFHVGYRFN